MFHAAEVGAYRLKHSVKHEQRSAEQSERSAKQRYIDVRQYSSTRRMKCGA
jgi:hypothetical protein